MKNSLEFVHLLDAVTTQYGVAFEHPRDTIMYLSEIRGMAANAELLDKLPRGHHNFTLIHEEDGRWLINSVCGLSLSLYLAQPNNTWKQVI